MADPIKKINKVILLLKKFTPLIATNMPKEKGGMYINTLTSRLFVK
jgi:hypothetical protein